MGNFIPLKRVNSSQQLNISSSNLGISNEKKEIQQTKRHRLSEPNLTNLRNEYFKKLNQGKEKEFEERMSYRGTFIKSSIDDDLDNASFINHSFVYKTMKIEDNTSLLRVNGNNPVSKRQDSISINRSRKSFSAHTLDLRNISNSNSFIFGNKEDEPENKKQETQNYCENISLSNITTSDTKNLSIRNGIEINDKISLGDNLNKDESTFENTKNLNLPSENLNCNNLNSVNSSNYDNISELSNMYKSIISQQRNNDYELNFVKNGEDLRRSYIAKLISKNVWRPSVKEKDHNTLIIFDWDDTLLCTSFLTPNGIFNDDLELNEKEKEKISKLEFSTLRLLTAAVEKGDTYIITNAAPGWVEYSCERFYPSVKKILDKLKIISARGEYESKYPGDSRMWKIQTFLKMQKNFDNTLVTNIICLGDSFIEMEAGHMLASKFSQAFIKTIKFRESPKPEELNKQLSLVADQFPVIYSTVKNLTIRVERKTKR